MKLYEITQQYREFIDAIDSGVIPEEAIQDTLEGFDGLFEDKADNIACLIKELDAEAEAIKAEAANLTERAKAKQNRAESLKRYLSNAMIALNIPKVETAKNKLTFRKSDAVIINEEIFVPWARGKHDEYMTYKEPTPNKTAIKDAIKNGIKVFGAAIETRQNLQIK